MISIKKTFIIEKYVNCIQNLLHIGYGFIYHMKTNHLDHKDRKQNFRKN